MTTKPTEPSPLMRDQIVTDRVRSSLPAANASTQLSVECLVHLFRAHRVVFEALNSSLSAHGVSLAHYNLLVLLNRSENFSLNMSEIGEQMSVTPTNITKLVNGLERKGLVARIPNPLDKRAVFAVLTESGKALVTRILPEQSDTIFRMFSSLSDEDLLELIHLLLGLKKSTDKFLRDWKSFSHSHTDYIESQYS